MKFLCPQPLTPNLPPLIYLPGLDGTGQLFHRQSPSLSRFFNIYCLSLPLTDKSVWPSLTQQILSLTKKAITDQEIYLCGESFGGCLALHLALQTQIKIKQLILINPASSLSRFSWLRWGSSFSQWLPSGFHSTTTLGFLPFLASLNRLEKSDRSHLLRAMRSVSPEVVSWRLGLLRDLAIPTPKLQQIQSPTLILASRQDRLLPSVDEGVFLQSLIPQARLAVLPDSGHACLLEQNVSLTEIFQHQGLLPRTISP
ncbi:MAG: alpha/beta fold hydrolase [Microcystaceae cyanobacterium]